jgi:hypothetical protein
MISSVIIQVFPKENVGYDRDVNRRGSRGDGKKESGYKIEPVQTKEEFLENDEESKNPLPYVCSCRYLRLHF